MRKKKKEEHENHERWLVSYADFITLLFAFFVVMYSISSVNEGKYRVLSQSMVEAFGFNPNGLILSEPDIKVNSDILGLNDGEYTLEDEKMRGIANELLQVMAPLVKEGQVHVAMTREGVVVDINAGVLFQTGEAVLEKSAIDVMKAVAGKLAGISNKIKIEGHTDSIPITTAMYPSNWELSSARASSVARLFIENGVNASRMTVIGFADQKPVSSNDSEAGRSRNRRVTVSVTTDTGS